MSKNSEAKSTWYDIRTVQNVNSMELFTPVLVVFCFQARS